MPRKHTRATQHQVREVLALWEALHAAFERALRGLPDAALAFSPQPRTRTLAQLVRHTLKWETYYVGCLPGGPKRRPALPKDFSSKRALLKSMQLVRRRSCDYFKSLSDDDLDRQLRVPWLPRMSVRQVLLYLMAHEFHHRAQVYTYIRLWESPGRRHAKPWWVVRGRLTEARKRVSPPAPRR